MSLLSSDFYKYLLSNSTDLLSVIDETGVYRFVGDSVKEILGYEASELVGRNAFEFIHPEDQAQALASLQLVKFQDKLLSAPFRFQSKNKGWRWIECYVTNMLENDVVNGYITNSRDITETMEERAKKELHEAYYQALFEQHPEAVFSLNTEGYFTNINNNAANILGVDAKAFKRLHYTSFVHPSELEETTRKFERTIQGFSQTLELKVIDGTAATKVFSLTVFPVYLKGEVIGLQGIGKDVTENVQTQKLMQAYSEQLRKILESITEPVFALDADWNYTFANKAYCESLESPATSFIGQRIWDYQPSLRDTKFYRICHKVASTGKTEYLDEEFESNASKVNFSFSIFPFEGGIAIHYVDTTAQNAIKYELQQLSLVASKTINGVVIMDPAGNIEWVNDGFTRLTGYTKEEVIGKVPSALLQGPETNGETSLRIRQKYREQIYFTEEVLNYRKNGEKYWVSIDVTPIKDSQGNLINYIAIQTDVTEKKKAAEELIKLADDLYKQNLNLQQFTYMVSHNLRAPVANALGLLYLAYKFDKDSPQFALTLDKLKASVNQLDGVIKDINTILSIRDADRTLPRESVNFLSITEEVLSTFQDEFAANQVAVNLDMDASYAMPSNKAYLYSIIYNLVSNAVKYRSPQRPLAIKISVAKDARGYVYTVQDNGLGMDMQLVQHQLFKLYKRFHPNTHGKGIGLFLVKTQVETIGGKIAVESELDAGTTFKLYLGAKHV